MKTSIASVAVFVAAGFASASSYAAESVRPPAPITANAPAPVWLVSDDRLKELEVDRSTEPDAELELALAYDERRDEQAVEMYHRAANQGVGVAELRLGALYEVGQGVTQSYEKARHHYERAITLGVPEANMRLGLFHLEGWGVQRDSTTAVRHIERAAQTGYAPAQRVLSDMFFTGVGVAADPAQALQWAERAAADRGPADQHRVGAIRMNAVKLPQDMQLAREWFQLSAEQDYSRGMLAMAGTFFRPGLNAETMQLGLRWLDLAVESGNSAAAFHRAGFFLLNPAQPPTAESEARARALLEQSAQAGENAALEVLELSKEGRSLADAFRFVVTVPYDDRYVQRLTAQAAQETGSHRRPVPIKMSRPIYPAALRLTLTEGETLVEFVVDPTGRVRDAHIVSSSHPGFSELSLAAARAWLFSPGMVEGRPVNTRMRIPIRFQMSDMVQR